MFRRLMPKDLGLSSIKYQVSSIEYQDKGLRIKD